MRGVVMAGVFLWSGGAGAQTMEGMSPAYVPMSPAIAADQDAMKKMMGTMEAPYSGDADHDFVTHMIGHHQGAIDMARIELTYGKDSKIRKLATDIIAAQQREIALMQGWLATHPASTPHPANPHVQYK